MEEGEKTEAMQKPMTPESDVGSFSGSDASSLFCQAVVTGDNVEIALSGSAQEALSRVAPKAEESTTKAASAAVLASHAESATTAEADPAAAMNAVAAPPTSQAELEQPAETEHDAAGAAAVASHAESATTAAADPAAAMNAVAASQAADLIADLIIGQAPSSLDKEAVPEEKEPEASKAAEIPAEDGSGEAEGTAARPEQLMEATTLEEMPTSAAEDGELQGELPEPPLERELQLDAASYALEKNDGSTKEDSDADVDGLQDWMQGVRRLLQQETAPLPAAFKGKLQAEDLVRALGLPLSRRSEPFAEASGRESESVNEYLGKGLETPPSPPAPSSDRSRQSRHSERTPIRQAMTQMLGGKEISVPAVGLKVATLTVDDNRQAALARQHQAEVPVLDFARINMGDEDDDTDETGNGATFAGSWERDLSPQSQGVPPINMAALDRIGGQDATILPDELQGMEASGEVPQRPESRAELMQEEAPSESQNSNLPMEASVMGSSPNKAKKSGSALKGAMPMASSPAKRSPFEIPLSRPTPRDLSVVRLPPMKHKKCLGTPGSRTKKAAKGLKPMTKPLIAVHSHVHHHYHVFSTSQASALGAQDAQGKAPLTDA